MDLVGNRPDREHGDVVALLDAREQVGNEAAAQRGDVEPRREEVAAAVASRSIPTSTDSPRRSMSPSL